MPDPIRLHGTVIAGGDPRRAFRRATLVADGKTVATLDEGEIAFSLFEGGTVVIEIPADGTLLIDPEVTVARGAWSELRDLPEAAGLARNAVAPFAEVELHTVGAAPGETVEVYGEPFEYDFDEAKATLRDAPVRRPSRVLAKIVAFGRADAAMKAMREAISALRDAEPTPPPPGAPSPREATREPMAVWIPTGAMALFALGGALLVGAGLSPVQTWRTEMLTALFAAFAVVLRPTPDVPDFRVREKALPGVSFGAVALPRLLMGGAVVVLVMAISGGHGRHDVELSPDAYLVGVLLVILGWAATVVVSQRPAYAALTKLAAAPRVTVSATEGLAGACEGTLSVATPVEVDGRRAAMGVVTEMDKRFGRSHPDVEKSVKLVSRGPLVLETGGARVELDLDECIWATTLTHRPDRPTSDYAISAWIPQGGRVAAYGRFVPRAGKGGKAALRLTAMGTQPAMLFATDAEEGPLALASRLVWQRRVTLAVLAVAAGVLVALHLHEP